MKTITINITHDEVFEEVMSYFKANDSKDIEIIINDDNAVMNITGTLEEMDND